jgi:hypothetical protein
VTPSPTTNATNLVPIDHDELFRKLTTTLALWQPPESFKHTLPIYLKHLGVVPRDLIEKALDHVERTCKWFPKPADILEPITKELARRREHARFMEEHSRQFQWSDDKWERDAKERVRRARREETETYG